MEGIRLGTQRCIVPGAVRCDFGGGALLWCRPGQVCDPVRAMCTEPVQVPPGHVRCPDGLTTCPGDMQCNPEGIALGIQRCIPAGSVRCDFGGGSRGLLWCRPGQVCDAARAMCADPVPVPPGHVRCPDGLTTCPSGTECNTEGIALGVQHCIAPGSVRCDFGGPPPTPGVRSAVGLLWCRPGQVCDPARAMCADPVPVPPGHVRCPDGLTTCPSDQQCNPEGIAAGVQHCIAPGSVRCDFGGGPRGLLWCRPGQVCDPARAMCTDPVQVPAGHVMCPDGLTTCPKDKQCNMDGLGSQRCITPGSMRCDFQGGPHWCEPGQVCDYERVMCTQPVKVPEGHVMCPDGLTTCPIDKICNMEATDSFRCLTPGAVRCDFGGGPPFYCTPPLVCDRERVMCSEPLRPPVADGYDPRKDRGTGSGGDIAGADAAGSKFGGGVPGADGPSGGKPGGPAGPQGPYQGGPGKPPTHVAGGPPVPGTPVGVPCWSDQLQAYYQAPSYPCPPTRTQPKGPPPFVPGGPPPKGPGAPPVVIAQKPAGPPGKPGTPPPGAGEQKAPGPSAPPQKAAAGGQCSPPLCREMSEVNCNRTNTGFVRDCAQVVATLPSCFGLPVGTRASEAQYKSLTPERVQAACFQNMLTRCQQGEAGGTGDWCVRKGADPDCATRARRVCGDPPKKGG